MKSIKKDDSLFRIYQKSKKQLQAPKTGKRNTISNLKLSQKLFTREENFSLSNSNIVFPKTSKAEKNVNIYSGIQNSLSQKKKNFSLREDINKEILSPKVKANPKKLHKIRKSKRMTNFTSNKYSKTFNKIPTLSVFYTKENFRY